MNRARHLFRSSILVILFFGLGKLTGLVRVRLVANAFGINPEYDAFTAANQLPEVFFIVIAGGSLAAAFIPVYSSYLTGESRDSSARLANTILTLVIALLGTISALAAIFAPWLAPILVPDFDPELQQLTASIMRIILVQTTIFGASGVLSSILNAHQHFALPALAPLALDLGYGIGLWFLVPSMGIHGLAWGTVAGSLIHVAVQLPALVRYRIRFRPDLSLRLAGVREVILLMLPRIVTLGTVQVADLYIIRLASGLPSGSTSGYFIGYALMQLPETLFGTAIALVLFPTMAELYNSGDIDGLKRTAVRALNIIWTLTIPSAVALILLGRPAISLALQGGAFDEASTRLVFSVLAVFSLRVVSEATLEVVARLYYAQHDTLTPMAAYLGWLVVNVLAAELLVDRWGVVGLAAASTIAFTLLSTCLLILNDRRLYGLGMRVLAGGAGRSLLAAAGMAATILATTTLFQSEILALGIGGIAGSAVYLLLHFFLGGQEVTGLFHLLRQRSA